MTRLLTERPTGPRRWRLARRVADIARRMLRPLARAVPLLALAGCTAPPPAPPPTPPPQAATVPPPPGVVATTVVEVVDGDTFRIPGGHSVRLIGVDTPETHHPTKPVGCFGPEASDYTTRLLPRGTPVDLVPGVERHDRYGRDLAYVYRATDGLFVNGALARDGLARTLSIAPNTALSADFERLASDARAARRGLWGRCPGAEGAAGTGRGPP